MIIWIASLAVLAVLVAACGSPTSTSVATSTSGHIIVVQLTLKDDSGTGIAGDDKTCWGAGGYADIDQGTTTTIKDPSGNMIGVATFAGRGATQKTTLGQPSQCLFAAPPVNVPDEATYSVEVSKRGPVAFSHADLAGAFWIASMTLGN